MSALITPIQNCTWVSWQCNKARKGNKSHTHYTDRSKCLFAGDMIVHIEDPKASTQKLLELTRKFSGITGNKVWHTAFSKSGCNWVSYPMCSFTMWLGHACINRWSLTSLLESGPACDCFNHKSRVEPYATSESQSWQMQLTPCFLEVLLGAMNHYTRSLTF